MAERKIQYRLEDVNIHDIDPGVRVRKDMGNIDSLAANIHQFGLHHPILVVDKECLPEKHEARTDARPFLLVAGERRFRACESLKHDKIAAKVTEHLLDEWEIRVIELDENLRRKEMTPVEEALAKKHIHDLYVERYGKASPGTGGGGHSVKDTAEILGESRANVSHDLKIAEYSNIIPELKDAKTKSEARKLISQLEQKVAREELAKRAKAKAEAKGAQRTETRKELLFKRYVTCDYFDGLKKLQDRSVDFMELDPDWGIMFKERVLSRGSLTAAEYDTLQPEDYVEGINEIMKAAYDVLKDNSWIIVWYSLEEWHKETREAIEAAGFTVCAMPAFWIHTSNFTATPAYRLGQRTESFFYARKGSPRIGAMGHPNTFTARTLNQNERDHPAEKPIELYEDIIKCFLGDTKGKLCVTGFAGSGNFLLAADNLEHNCIGFDTSKAYQDNFVLKVNKGNPGQFKSYIS